MKKIFTLIAAAAMLAVSCQKEITPEKANSNNPVEGKLTATIVQTKVSYSETPELKLQPAWEVGDKIIGFDEKGSTYTLTVASVEAETATATLEGTVPDGALHLIYKSGAKASDISDKSLAVSYAAQAGDKTMPAVMLADGTVENGSCDFAFKNAGAIIGISAVKGVPSGATISKITVEGENLSAATVALSGSALALTATPAATDAISTAALSGITTTDANGTLSSPVFIAVPANATIAKVSAFVTKEPETMKIPSTDADREGKDYVTIAGKKWAKWNVGANSQSEYGWYFHWAGTEGYVRYANTWQLHDATSIEFSYTLSSSKTAVASDYLYVKTQSFTTAGHRFDWAYAPYHTGSDSKTGYTKYIPTAKSSYWSGTGVPDNKLVLDPEDDAASVNWGCNWRMPTNEDFRALYEATYWAWDDNEGYYVFSPDDSHKAGTRAGFVPFPLNKADALLFFPAAGRGDLGEFPFARSFGSYWSSNSIYEPDPSNIGIFIIYRDGVSFPTNHFSSRCVGYSVRPVSD